MEGSVVGIVLYFGPLLAHLVRSGPEVQNNPLVRFCGTCMYVLSTRTVAIFEEKKERVVVV